MQQRLLFYFIVSVIITGSLNAQRETRKVLQHCATMSGLEQKFEKNPLLKSQFEKERAIFKKSVTEKFSRLYARGSGGNDRTSYSIPIVFHVVLNNQAKVTDAQILAQLDTLNKDFSGTNGDSTRIPSFFKPLFGKSGIQFCLAQRTPDGEATTGIERVETSKTSFVAESEDVKHLSRGGADIWDDTKYYNVWICTLSNGVLGYSSFPDTGVPDEQGVEIDYGSLPKGSLIDYNSGKTLTHETGHYFNLFHIWGDDNGECTGSDDVDDTPNQADATTSCYNGIKTDACTLDGNGIMYENYMDYSYDSCLVMFTNEQVNRMEDALKTYRSSLLSSNGCTAPVLKNFDARLSSLDEPAERLCSGSFAPSVTIKNKGSEILTSLKITANIDNGNITTYNWKGSLPYLAATTVTLNNLTTLPGTHTLTIYVSNPNNSQDEDVTNDTITSVIQFNNPLSEVSESFEANVSPPKQWEVLNSDNSVTWKQVTGVAKTGNSSIMMENFNYNAIGESDDLLLPNVTLQKVDSAFLSFQVAAAVYSNPAATSNVWDTLQVLASTDCGQTYTSIYKKFGRSLITRTTPVTTGFVPTASEWRKDSINLSNYIGEEALLLKFRNTNGYENNIYLDDVNFRTVTINANLKSQGFLVTPNPAKDIITIQLYPQPTNLRALQIYSVTGQKIYELIIQNEQANNSYKFDISKNAAGTYIVRAIFTDRVMTKKIIKY